MSSASSFQWTALPDEMKRAVLNQLVIDDIWACARIDRESYQLSLPFLFEVSAMRRGVIVFVSQSFLVDSQAQFPAIAGWIPRGSAGGTVFVDSTSGHNIRL